MRIELKKTRCGQKRTDKKCPFYYWPRGFLKLECILLEEFLESRKVTENPLRCAACRREFPDNVIEIKAGK